MSDSTLTKEQEQVLSDVYRYKDSSQLSDDEVKTLRTMFDTPDKFALLRKALSVLTMDEQGLLVQRIVPTETSSAVNPEAYAREIAVNMLSDEKIRVSLVRLYQVVREQIVTEKRAEFEADNKREHEEEESAKKAREEIEARDKQYGDNL